MEIMCDKRDTIPRDSMYIRNIYIGVASAVNEYLNMPYMECLGWIPDLPTSTVEHKQAELRVYKLRQGSALQLLPVWWLTMPKFTWKIQVPKIVPSGEDHSFRDGPDDTVQR